MTKPKRKNSVQHTQERRNDAEIGKCSCSILTQAVSIWLIWSTIRGYEMSANFIMYVCIQFSFFLLRVKTARVIIVELRVISKFYHETHQTELQQF